jgi:signal transduction histidine kinase
MKEKKITSPHCSSSLSYRRHQPLVSDLARLLLAGAAVVILVLDPAEPAPRGSVISITLVLYLLYSAAVYTLAGPYIRPVGPFRNVEPWVDIAWFTWLAAFSNSTIVSFFFFPIITASFRWGFMSGAWATYLSTSLFVVVGFNVHYAEPTFELNIFLLRITLFLILGFLIAHRGGSEVTLKKRLGLLNILATAANPRLGVDRTLSLIMERLRDFYEADACLYVEFRFATAEVRLRRAERADPGGAIYAKPVPRELAEVLGLFADTQEVLYCRGPHLFGYRLFNCEFQTVKGSDEGAPSREKLNLLTTILECESLLSLPFFDQEEEVSRLYLVSKRRHAFTREDVEFLRQVRQSALPILENIQLMDRLASRAAEEGRRRIARDLHDSVVQSYQGLYLGLVALRPATVGAAAGRLDRLIEVAGQELAKVRRYVKKIETGGNEYGADLLAEVRRYAEAFTKTTGIVVSVQADPKLCLSNRLAGEIFQAVEEGLSNVRRHTRATRATVVLACDGERLLLRIEDAGAPEERHWEIFTPRSLTERAVALGGRASVERGRDGGAVVAMEIPL